MESPEDLLKQIEESSKLDMSGKNEGLLRLLATLARLLTELDRRAGTYAEKSVKLNESIRCLTIVITILTVVTIILGVPSCIVSCQALMKPPQTTQNDKSSKITNAVINNTPKPEDITLDTPKETSKDAKTNEGGK